MTTRSMTTDLLDPKFATDLVGTAASLDMLDAAPALSRTVAHTPEFHAPVPATPVLTPEMHALFPQTTGLDDFTMKDPDSGDPHHGTVIPLPDPKFGVGDGMFPIEGTDGDDDIDGTSAGDIIYGHGGDDTIHGAAGYDTIDGNDGWDTIYGEAGNDFLSGNDGDDWLMGGDGGDHLSGGADQDTLQGMDGNDWLFGDAGSDVLSGDEGDDILIGGPGGIDYMTGGAGADAFLSLDDIQEHLVSDYSAAEGDTVDGASWEYDAFTNQTTVFSEGGNAVFVLQNYNAQVSGINLVEYNPAPPV
jgi:Ca2+-binding RTX toxin-like protein